jgi:Ala-tRNA(Pro) deacylase
MGIAIKLQQYLGSEGIHYDSVEHRRTGCAMRSAEVSHIPSNCMAKAVVLKDRSHYFVTIVPASRQVRLDEVGGLLHQPVALASEDEIARLFPDCEPGAISAIVTAYGLQCCVDESLDASGDIYFEAGDHRTLVHLTSRDFQKLMRNVPHGRFSSEPVSANETWLYFGA